MLFLATFCFIIYAISTVMSLYTNVKKNIAAPIIIASIILQALILFCLFTLVMIL